MNTRMLSQRAGGEGGVPRSEADALQVKVALSGGATTKDPDQKGMGVGVCASCCSPEGIAERATTITPLLAEILAHQSPGTLGNVG